MQQAPQTACLHLAAVVPEVGILRRAEQQVTARFYAQLRMGATGPVRCMPTTTIHSMKCAMRQATEGSTVCLSDEHRECSTPRWRAWHRMASLHTANQPPPKNIAEDARGRRNATRLVVERQGSSWLRVQGAGLKACVKRVLRGSTDGVAAATCSARKGGDHVRDGEARGIQVA